MSQPIMPKKYYGHCETRQNGNTTTKVFIPPEIEEIRDRLAAWLSKYKLRTGSEVKSVSQIADIATIEKLISSLKSLL